MVLNLDEVCAIAIAIAPTMDTTRVFWKFYELKGTIQGFWGNL